jgi:phosphoserine aminotransferase
MRPPTAEELDIDPEGAYFHFCLNETAEGVTLNDFPWE